MSKLLIRTLSGLTFAFLSVLLLSYNQITATLYLYALMMLCLREFQNLRNYRSIWSFVTASLIFYNVGLSFWVDMPFLDNSKSIAAYALGASLVIEMIFVLLSKLKMKAFINISLNLFYIVLPYSLALGLGYIAQDFTAFSSTILISVFVLLWSNDSFAFLIGKNIGKTPLAPKISPNKTIEGFIGGLISTVITAIGISFFYPEISVFNWIILALIVSIFGVLGDLLESYFKRKAGVKDSANAIPGHGGFLDRLDSFILAAPFTYLFLTYIF